MWVRLLTVQIALLIFIKPMRIKLKLKRHLIVSLKKARKTESDPCDIKSEITETENGANLTARFTFSCQAEAMIFELANR